MEDKKQFKLFDLVSGPGFDIGVIVSKQFDCYIHDTAIFRQDPAYPSIDLINPQQSFTNSFESVVVRVFLPLNIGQRVVDIASLTPCKLCNKYDAFIVGDAIADAQAIITALKDYTDHIAGVEP